jgi:hypothetical protein
MKKSKIKNNNPVAKFAFRFNKATVQKSKISYSRKLKHKGHFNDK